MLIIKLAMLSIWCPNVWSWIFKNLVRKDCFKDFCHYQLFTYWFIRHNKKTKNEQKSIKSIVLQPLITCLADASLKVGFSIQSFGNAISTQWPCYSYPMNEFITRRILWEFEFPTLPFTSNVQNVIPTVNTVVSVWRQSYDF